ncbi:carbon-nitrogen hydrolase family protein [Bacillota bacterium LX-D]|nr:carbon-nitrogen hydrolase family protein [Bacillota bacterium LX-D]
MNNLKIALCQMLVENDKKKNLIKAKKMIERAVSLNANFVMLPEMFNCPYDISYFKYYAEKLSDGETIQLLSNLAQKNKVYIVGGSIPEIRNHRLYNTSIVYNAEGNIVGTYQKAHLFDVHIPDGISFQESKVLSPGEKIAVIDTSFCKIGVAICYDIRFPELFRAMALAGAKIIFVPAAFNMTTGPAHWSTLFKSRALDNQVFIFGNSPARNEHASYVAYGHSLAINPWGQIIAEADEQEKILLVDIKLDEIEKIRSAIPIWKHRRTDIYS